MKVMGVLALLFLAMTTAAASAPSRQSPATVKVNSLRDAYFGDLHMHTSYSYDSYIAYGTTVDPDTAYRFAKGEVVEYLGQPAQRREPLDFMAVTDHGECIGVFHQIQDPNSAVSRSEVGQELKSIMANMMRADGRIDWNLFFRAPKDVQDRFGKFRKYFSGDGNSLPSTLVAESASAWRRVIDHANRNYVPGRFTTFIAFEWTSFGTDEIRANLHRNVVFKGDTAPYPFTALDSKNPEDLWVWLESIRKQGDEALAIPHNGNASNGQMFEWTDSRGQPIDVAYAERRAANEPLSEMSQIKGVSETHPLLSPNDELADYQILDFLNGTGGRLQGSYLRDALGRGLVIERNLGVNPFRYGFVGGADLHSGLSVSAQADFAGGDDGTNLGGGRPARDRAAAILSGRNQDNPSDYSLKMTAGSLTGVWAESNTRESVYSALRRKETFATTGTRLKFRFFGGWSFNERLLHRTNWVATAYATGVPMGAILPPQPPGAKSPGFLIWAMKGPNGGNLDRVQVVKVWEENGQQREDVFDVVWSGQRRPDSKSGRIEPVGNTVNLATGAFDDSIGATELRAFWRDPSFKPHQLAAYYLRVLEIPTPRWSTLLAIRNGLPLPQDVPATIQQRGWSSPIWYSARMTTASRQTGDGTHE